MQQATYHLLLDIKHHLNNNREKFKFVNDILYFEECLYIQEGPTHLYVLQAHYDFPTTKFFFQQNFRTHFLRFFVASNTEGYLKEIILL